MKMLQAMKLGQNWQNSTPSVISPLSFPARSAITGTVGGSTRTVEFSQSRTENNLDQEHMDQKDEKTMSTQNPNEKTGYGFYLFLIYTTYVASLIVFKLSLIKLNWNDMIWYDEKGMRCHIRMEKGTSPGQMKKALVVSTAVTNPPGMILILVSVFLFLFFILRNFNCFPLSI